MFQYISTIFLCFSTNICVLNKSCRLKIGVWSIRSIFQARRFPGESHPSLDTGADRPMERWKGTLWQWLTVSYWKWPFIVDLPINSMVIFQFVMWLFTRPRSHQAIKYLWNDDVFPMGFVFPFRHLSLVASENRARWSQIAVRHRLESIGNGHALNGTHPGG